MIILFRQKKIDHLFFLVLLAVGVGVGQSFVRPLENTFDDIHSYGMANAKYEVYNPKQYTTICWNEKVTLNFFNNGTEEGYVEYSISLELSPKQDQIRLNGKSEPYEIVDANGNNRRELNFVTVKQNYLVTVKENRTVHCKTALKYSKIFMEFPKRKRVEIKLIRNGENSRVKFSSLMANQNLGIVGRKQAFKERTSDISSEGEGSGLIYSNQRDGDVSLDLSSRTDGEQSRLLNDNIEFITGVGNEISGTGTQDQKLQLHSYTGAPEIGTAEHRMGDINLFLKQTPTAEQEQNTIYPTGYGVTGQGQIQLPSNQFTIGNINNMGQEPFGIQLNKVTDNDNGRPSQGPVGIEVTLPSNQYTDGNIKGTIEGVPSGIQLSQVPNNYNSRLSQEPMGIEVTLPSSQYTDGNIKGTVEGVPSGIQLNQVTNNDNGRLTQGRMGVEIKLPSNQYNIGNINDNGRPSQESIGITVAPTEFTVGNINDMVGQEPIGIAVTLRPNQYTVGYTNDNGRPSQEPTGVEITVPSNQFTIGTNINNMGQEPSGIQLNKVTDNDNGRPSQGPVGIEVTLPSNQYTDGNIKGTVEGVPSGIQLSQVHNNDNGRLLQEPMGIEVTLPSIQYTDGNIKGTVGAIPSGIQLNQVINTDNGRPSQEPAAIQINLPSTQYTGSYTNDKGMPSQEPTGVQINLPSNQLTGSYTNDNGMPSQEPTGVQINLPSNQFTGGYTNDNGMPLQEPTGVEIKLPSTQYTGGYTIDNGMPTQEPTGVQIKLPSNQYTGSYTIDNGMPTQEPTGVHIKIPSTQYTGSYTNDNGMPSQEPTGVQINLPSNHLTGSYTNDNGMPSQEPTGVQINLPSNHLTGSYTNDNGMPTQEPTGVQIKIPSNQYTGSYTNDNGMPSQEPTGVQINLPSNHLTGSYTNDNGMPTQEPTGVQIKLPSNQYTGGYTIDNGMSSQEPTGVQIKIPSNQYTNNKIKVGVPRVGVQLNQVTNNDNAELLTNQMGIPIGHGNTNINTGDANNFEHTQFEVQPRHQTGDSNFGGVGATPESITQITIPGAEVQSQMQFPLIGNSDLANQMQVEQISGRQGSTGGEYMDDKSMMLIPEEVSPYSITQNNLYQNNGNVRPMSPFSHLPLECDDGKVAVKIRMEVINEKGETADVEKLVELNLDANDNQQINNLNVDEQLKSLIRSYLADSLKKAAKNCGGRKKNPQQMYPQPAFRTVNDMYNVMSNMPPSMYDMSSYGYIPYPAYVPNLQYYPIQARMGPDLEPTSLIQPRMGSDLEPAQTLLDLFKTKVRSTFENYRANMNV